MNTTQRPSWREKNQILVGIYSSEESAKAVAKRLIDENFPMDLLSVLGRIRPIGDDPLGVYCLNVGERVRMWGKQGAIWGSLWGVLGGAAGFFVIPGIGPLAAFGFIVEAIATGALLGAGTLAGAAAVSQLAVAFHRAGIAQDRILSLHEAITEGKYLVMLRGASSEIEQWRKVLQSGHPSQICVLPYSRLIDKESPVPTTAV